MLTLHARHLRLLVVAAACLLVVAAWYPPLQQLANDQVDAGLKRALISFTSARTLNALISVLQGTQLGLQPAGVGVMLAPGQVLDPINQMIEQFSSLMLVASVSFGIQKVLLLIGAHWLISLAVSLVLLGWAAQHWRQQRSAPWLTRLVVVLLLFRFAVPAVTLGSDLVYQQFLQQQFNEHQAALRAVAGELQRATPAELAQAPAGSAEPGWLARVQRWAESVSAKVQVNFDAISQSVRQLPEKLVAMTVIFVLQTVLVPVFLLWALCKLLFAAIRPVAR